MPVDPRLQAMADAPMTDGPTLHTFSTKRQAELYPDMPPLAGKYAARGYAAPPGTGPKGETCRTCKHVYDNTAGRTFYKCALSPCQSRTKKGDVSTRSPACSKWEAKA